MNHVMLLLISFTSSCAVVLSAEATSINNNFTDPTPLVYHENQYFIEIRNQTPRPLMDQLLLDLNSVEVWFDEDINLALWEVISFPFTSPTGEIITDINGVIASSKKKTEIESAGFNTQSTVNSKLSGTENSCFNLQDFYDTQGAESIMVSILDTGISPTISSNSIPGFNYNIQIESAYDYVNNDPFPDDENGHGTHIAGLIHSITHQSNPSNPSITFDIRKTHDSEGKAFMSNIVFALMDAIDEGADIINMSFSAQDIYHDTLFFPLRIIIEDALLDDGQLIIAAAGNQSSNNNNYAATALPASFPSENVISVSSVSCMNTLSLFSNYGFSSVDLAVYGENIPGPALGSTGLISLSGTSQAAAIVTAISALKATHQPDFNFRPIVCALYNSSVHYENMTDKNLADGILHIESMLQYGPDCIIDNNCEQSFVGPNKLAGSLHENAIYETNLEIHSTQAIKTPIDVTFDSKESTTLLPRFEVAKGTVLSVLTSGCL